ncbi:ribonuclease HI family protein [Candidatus Gracilibacteria bacterium]|nr:ribonuclease HI family protein [Candidatus Gracilibacteria bacterium]MCF7819440.1 ribonuclease HI family protein [Candidatus Gracilibacteria bacterium]
MNNLLSSLSTQKQNLKPRKGTLYCDGASRDNPGKSAGAAVLYDEKKKEIAYGGVYCGVQTNNFAEYAGLIHGLGLALENEFTDLEVVLDSKLIVQQMSGDWKVKNKNIRPSWEKAKALCEKFHSVRFRHVMRSKNTVADKIANNVLDQHE